MVVENQNMPGYQSDAKHLPIRNLNRCAWFGLWLAGLILTGCDMSEWNNPYPAAQRGKNILYASFEERPKHLDPVRSYSSNEYAFIGQIYEPPLQYHYLKRPYELMPLTATAMPEVRYYDAAGQQLPANAAADLIASSEYVIHIKPGILYQPHPAFARDANGNYRYLDLKPAELAGIRSLADFPATGTRELVAADYVYQIKRLAHPRLNSPIQGLMNDYITGLAAYAKMLSAADEAQPELEGFKTWLDLRTLPLEGAEVIDRYTYRVRIKGKYPQFMYWLAMPFFAPMPWEAARFYAQPGMQTRNITLDWYPVGTGAYMLTVNNPNYQMVLTRNPNFHGMVYPSQGEQGDVAAGLLADAGKPLPFIDQAIYRLEKESIPYWNKFLQGYYDTSGISADSFDQAIQFSPKGEAALTPVMRQKGIELLTAVQSSTFYMGFNMLDPVVGGDSMRARLLRRAISIAVDYEDYISIFANGRGVSAQGIVPPGIFGHGEGKAAINPFVYDWVNGRPQRKAVAVAKQLLAQAGYPNGRNRKTGKPLLIKLDVTGGGPEDKARFDWLRKQFRKIDLELVIRNTDYNRFQEKMRTGNAQVFMWGWNADYPDPENFMFLLYGPNGKVKHGGENAANYSNAEFDRLFDKMKNMENSPARYAIILQMTDIARRDAPWLWGMHPKQFVLTHSWYKNAKPNLMAHNTLMYKRIDPQLREQKRREWNRPVIWPVVVLSLVVLLSIIPGVIVYRRKEHQAARHTASS
jgi:oligopeptide transport system substrate-binding protein